MKYPSPKVGNYLVFATRHGINISKDIDLYCFARSGLHTYTIELIAGQRHEFRSHSALTDSRFSEHALVILNSCFKLKNIEILYNTEIHKSSFVVK
jgi:hypothetical protein